MRFLSAVLFSGLAVVFSAGASIGSEVEVKGPHICCGNCVSAVKNILGKVDGVSEVKADTKSKVVTFTAKDDAAANAGVKALVEGGFFGAATADGKEIKIDVATPKKGDTAAKVTVKDVHACCGQCHTAIQNLFKGSKVTISGVGPRRTVIVEGTDIDRGGVIESLRKKGFNGTIEK